MSPTTYKDAGVDTHQAAKLLEDFAQVLKSRPQDPRILSGIGPFAACLSLKGWTQGMEDPILATCCDGVGTKALLAARWGRLEGLGQDLVAMNVNDLLCVGALPMAFLDYYACGTLDGKQLHTLLMSILGACDLAGCPLVGGETAEMPGLYRDQDFDLAGFAVGVVDRAKMLGPHRVKPNDSIVAIESSGLHSNGYSLVRKVLESHALDPLATPPFEPSNCWADVLLAPTRIYTQLLADLLPQLHAAAHITGGGLFENLPRALPPGTSAELTAWEMPGLFKWLQSQTQLTTDQMAATFNCGVGMIAICDEPTAQRLVAHCNESQVKAWIAGTVQASGTEHPQVIWK